MVVIILGHFDSFVVILVEEKSNRATTWGTCGVEKLQRKGSKLAGETSGAVGLKTVLCKEICLPFRTVHC